MAQFEHKPGSFTLFKNDKGDNAARPDYRGEGKDLEGNAIEVAAWLKDGSKGKFMSCSFKVKGTKPQETRTVPAKQTGTSFDDMDDDIPF